ncbi:hypothetical protein E4U17_003224 [Claviceps sp. LM77 group G4]|nr:hypothetical protein E4U17_003224 [Claviceps sp. LM77 group G4]KAG6071291.1 hypothetical protein E4U33_003766 [Claviceps sp. LM78 group G4]KAG6075386.1 hypothetical protein E4U16_003380 [Claviceps sp. LM84 group G4]
MAAGIVSSTFALPIQPAIHVDHLRLLLNRLLTSMLMYTARSTPYLFAALFNVANNSVSRQQRLFNPWQTTTVRVSFR